MTDLTLTSEQIEAAAEYLLQARAGRQTLTAVIPAPQNLADSYAIQNRVVAESAEEVVGWKIGATSAFAQEFLGCDGPFSAPMFASGVYDSGAHIAVDRLLNPMMEPEIAVTLGQDLPMAGGASLDDVTAAVRDVRPSLELVGGCFPDISTCGLEAIVADRGANLGVVLGEAMTDWQGIDLGAIEVTLLKNEGEAGKGVGSDALGGPFHALAWLATHLAERGLSLRAGDIVTTGTCGGVALLDPGDRGSATHGVLGGVSFTYG